MTTGNSKISALPAAATPLTGAEILPLVTGGITEWVTVANLTAGRVVAAAGTNVVGVPVLNNNSALYPLTYVTSYDQATPAPVVGANLVLTAGAMVANTIVGAAGLGFSVGLTARATVSDPANNALYAEAAAVEAIATRYAVDDTGNTFNVNFVTGVYAVAQHASTLNSAAVTQSMVGANVGVQQNAVGTTITVGTGVYSSCYVAPACTIVDYRDLWIVGSSGGGTVTNKWGLYQSNAAHTNYMAARLGISTTTPDAALHIAAAPTLTSTALSPSTYTVNVNVLNPTTLTTGYTGYSTSIFTADVVLSSSAQSFVAGTTVRTRLSNPDNTTGYMEVCAGDFMAQRGSASDAGHVGGANSITTIYAVAQHTAGLNSAAVSQGAVGVNAGAQNNATGTTIVAGTSVYASGFCDTGAIITTYRDLWLAGTTGAGTVTNKWGLYQANAAHKNYFAGQIGVGTTGPASCAILDVQTTTQGLRFPNMTTTQKNAIASPVEGLVVYDTTLHKLCVRTAAAWETITSA